MRALKWLSPLIAVAVGVFFFNLGQRYAQGAPPAVERIEFSQQDGGSRMKVSAKGDVRFVPHMDTKMKEIILSAPNATAAQGVYSTAYKDALIDSVRISQNKKMGELWITVSFKTPDITFHRSLEDDGRIFVFDFVRKEKALKLYGFTPETFLAKLKGEAVPQAAKKEEPKPAPIQAAAKEAPVPEKAVAKVEEKPAELVAAEVRKSFETIDRSYASMEMESGRRDFQDIMTLFQQGHLDEGAALSEAFIANYPKSIYLEKVYFSRADALYQLAKKEKMRAGEALEAYKTALARYPDSPLTQQGLLRRAGVYEEMDFDLEALVEYNMAQKANPKGKYAVAAMIGRAKIYMRKRKFEKAHEEIEKVLTLFPNKREARDVKYLIAEAFFDQGKYAEARSIFEEAQKIWPTYPKTRPVVYMKIADTYYHLGQKERAVEYWASIANLFPSVSTGRKAMLRMGEYGQETNRKKEASRIFETLVTQFPESDEAVYARLRLATLGVEDPSLLKTSRIFDYHAFENPLKTFDEILAKYPERHGEEALVRKGKALAAAKRYIASILVYKELLKSYPGSRMSTEVFELIRSNLFRLIETFHEQEGFFIALLTYFDNFNPFLKTINDPGILIKIADSFAVMTLYDRAHEYYAMANKNDPEGEFRDLTDFRIAKARLFGGDSREAERLFVKYIAERPTHPSTITARHFLGFAYQAQGKNAEAAAEWRIAVERDPSNTLVPNTAYNLGRLYKKEKKNNLAIDAFNLALAAWKPAYKGAEEPGYLRDAKYHLAETYFLNEDFNYAIREANQFMDKYSGDQRKPWLDYIVASSLAGANEDEKAVEKLKELADKDKTVIGKVASAKLQNAEWKNKNPALFPN